MTKPFSQRDVGSSPNLKKAIIYSSIFIYLYVHFGNISTKKPCRIAYSSYTHHSFIVMCLDHNRIFRTRHYYVDNRVETFFFFFIHFISSINNNYFTYICYGRWTRCVSTFVYNNVDDLIICRYIIVT